MKTTNSPKTRPLSPKTPPSSPKETETEIELGSLINSAKLEKNEFKLDETKVNPEKLGLVKKWGETLFSS